MNPVKLFLYFCIVLSLVSCRTTRFREITTRINEKNVSTRIDTVQLYDSTHVVDYVKDSIHYIFRDHYSDGVRKIYVYQTDTVLQVDSVYVKENKNSSGDWRITILQIIVIASLLFLLVFIIKKT